MDLSLGTEYMKLRQEEDHMKSMTLIFFLFNSEHLISTKKMFCTAFMTEFILVIKKMVWLKG